MSYKLYVRKEAELDLETTFNYYEEQRTGLGHDFLLCVEEALSKIQRNPEICQVVHKQLRRKLTYRFPYAIFYLVEQDYIVITAIFHARQNPKRWEQRT